LIPELTHSDHSRRAQLFMRAERAPTSS